MPASGPRRASTRGRKAAAAPKPRASRRHAGFRAKVRMYRQGFGDCFLVTLPRSGSGRDAFHIMIDCGVLLGTPEAAARMARVVNDIAEATGGRVDLLVVTHEHWDHVSGFLQARNSLARIRFDAVWMGWTENPEDEQARRLEAGRARALAALRLGATRLRLAGAAEPADEVEGLLGFFGAAGGSTRDALQAARDLASPDGPRYAEPGEPPAQFPGVAARLYVLGPPRDETLLLRSDPSRHGGETYGLAGFTMDETERMLSPSPPEGPFGPRLSIPLEVARAMPFFRRYWAEGTAGEMGEAWRRIDGTWLDGLADLAIRLDHDTNNSSLALAVELADGDVLLFAADAQVGNWLSWHGLVWEADGRKVTGSDLLARTVLYKVGHHGSHNATLRDGGLELMSRLKVAMIPVDEETARRRRWMRMPLDELVDRLEQKAAVLRSDRPASAGIDTLKEAPLFFEVRF